MAAGRKIFVGKDLIIFISSQIVEVLDKNLKMVGALYNHRQDGIPDQDLKAIQNLLRGTRLIDFGGC